MANDTVLEQTQTVYDGDGNVIETIDRQRFHNATGTGAVGHADQRRQGAGLLRGQLITTLRIG